MAAGRSEPSLTIRMAPVFSTMNSRAIVPVGRSGTAGRSTGDDLLKPCPAARRGPGGGILSGAGTGARAESQRESDTRSRLGETALANPQECWEHDDSEDARSGPQRRAAGSVYSARTLDLRRPGGDRVTGDIGAPATPARWPAPRSWWRSPSITGTTYPLSTTRMEVSLRLDGVPIGRLKQDSTRAGRRRTRSQPLPCRSSSRSRPRRPASRHARHRQPPVCGQWSGDVRDADRYPEGPLRGRRRNDLRAASEPVIALTWAGLAPGVPGG